MSKRPSYEPHSESCSNPGRDDYWTCPACYHDLGDVGRGRHTCPECERELECTLDSEPVCTTALVETEDAE